MPKSKLPDKEFIWTNDLAYVVGLLVTDGNLSSNRRTIVMRSSDIDLLKTFKKCLNINNAIGSTRNGSQYSYRVQLGNVQFYRWLLKIGLFPNKTYTIGAIQIPDVYFRDFLRGHFDGDGTIFGYTDRYNNYKGRIYTNNRIFIKFVSASQAHITWLYEKIKNLIGLNGALIKNKPLGSKRVSLWEIKFAKKESVKLIHLLYYKPGLPCLQRKFDKAQKLLAIIKSEKRRVYSRVTV